MNKVLIKASKFMSLVLRHKPEEIGIVLDPQGWVPISELVDKSNGSLTVDLVHFVVAENDKKRFAISPDGELIRANQGHSINVDLDFKASIPPQTLFHGTATRFVDSIRKQGLMSQARQHVHLSFDAVTANSVGKRHGKPEVLQIMAGDMHRDGILFFVSDNGVWLTDHVPAEYIKFSD